MLRPRRVAIGLSPYSQPVMVARTFALRNARPDSTDLVMAAGHDRRCLTRYGQRESRVRQCGTLPWEGIYASKNAIVAPPTKKAQLNTTASGKGRHEVDRLAALEYLRALRPGVDHVLQELVDEVRGVFGTDLCMINLNLTDVQYFRAWSGELDPNL